jgi:hypothetical protein
LVAGTILKPFDGNLYRNENGSLIHFFYILQWKQWLRSCSAKEGFESCGGNTALLIIRTVEIASGRYSLKEHDVNCSEYTQLERLTSSICGKLTSRVAVQV